MTVEVTVTRSGEFRDHLNFVLDMAFPHMF